MSRVLITGGGSGIGHAMASAFAAHDLTAWRVSAQYPLCVAISPVACAPTALIYMREWRCGVVFRPPPTY